MRDYQGTAENQCDLCGEPGTCHRFRTLTHYYFVDICIRCVVWMLNKRSADEMGLMRLRAIVTPDGRLLSAAPYSGTAPGRTKIIDGHNVITLENVPRELANKLFRFVTGGDDFASKEAAWAAARPYWLDAD